MKKITSFISLVAIFNLLLLGGFAGFVYASGRLDAEKAGTMMAMLRHKGTPAQLGTQVQLILNPPPASAATAPAAQSVPEIPAQIGEAATAAERLRYTQAILEQQRLQLADQEQELRHRQELLEQRRRELDVKVTELEQQKKDLQDQLASVQGKAHDENFDHAMSLYNELKPKQVKDIFIGLSSDVVVDYIKAMEPERAGKIISEFKSEDEKKFIQTVLEKIRLDGTISATAPSVVSSGTP